MLKYCIYVVTSNTISFPILQNNETYYNFMLIRCLYYFFRLKSAGISPQLSVSHLSI